MLAPLHLWALSRPAPTSQQGSHCVTAVRVTIRGGGNGSGGGGASGVLVEHGGEAPAGLGPCATLLRSLCTPRTCVVRVVVRERTIHWRRLGSRYE
jgi:hypothetical protein